MTVYQGTTDMSKEETCPVLELTEIGPAHRARGMKGKAPTMHPAQYCYQRLMVIATDTDF